MSIYIIWLVIMLLCIIVEMLLGTLYLFALALGCIVAAILAYFQSSINTQIIFCGIITIIGAIGFYFLKRRNQKQDRDDNLDIGQIIVVKEVNEDGSSLVTYRGAKWRAYAQNGTLTAGVWKIAQTKGIHLILKQDKE